MLDHWCASSIDYGRNMKLTNFQALSFDCYGTLIDWEAGIGSVLRAWADRHGVVLSTEELLVAYGRQMAGLLDREAIRRLLAEDVPRTLEVSRAAVLLPEGHDLASTGEVTIRLPFKV